MCYYPVPNHSKSKRDKIIDLWKIHDVTRDEILWPYYEEKFKRLSKISNQISFKYLVLNYISNWQLE